MVLEKQDVMFTDVTAEPTVTCFTNTRPALAKYVLVSDAVSTAPLLNVFTAIYGYPSLFVSSMPN
jgi:hypothetical protein